MYSETDSQEESDDQDCKEEECIAAAHLAGGWRLRCFPLCKYAQTYVCPQMRHLEVLRSPATRGASVSSGIVLSMGAMKMSHRVVVCKSMCKFAWYLTLFLATIATAENAGRRHEQTINDVV